MSLDIPNKLYVDKNDKTMGIDRKNINNDSIVFKEKKIEESTL